MRKQTRKRGRAIGAAVTTAALALSLLIPGAVSAQTDFGLSVGPLNLQRDCGAAVSGMDAQGQCSYTIAQPSGSQFASVSAANGNDSSAVQSNLQDQSNILAPMAPVSNTAIVGGEAGSIRPHADLTVRSGYVDVYGHTATVDMSGVLQNASASPSGSVVVTNATGNVDNLADGTNVAVTNAGAANSSSSSIDGSATTNADGASLGGFGGDNQGNVAGSGPFVSGFNVDGGWGGSNVNLALGDSTAAGGSGGVATADSIMGGAPDNYASADGANARSGYGAQADPAQIAGNGGYAGFTVTGRGGDASGSNSANGGDGLISNSNSVSGDSTAWGAAVGGVAGNASAGPSQLGITGQNDTTVTMNGGIAGNALTFGMVQRGDVLGRSGDVANTGSPSAQANITIDQGSNPQINVTNNPVQDATNTANNSQTASSGNQNGNPSQTVSSGNQFAGNLGIQDVLKTDGSFNTDNSNSNNTTISGSHHHR